MLFLEVCIIAFLEYNIYHYYQTNNFLLQHVYKLFNNCLHISSKMTSHINDCFARLST